MTDPELITQLANEVRDVVVGPEIANALHRARAVRYEIANLNERLGAWQAEDWSGLAEVMCAISNLEREEPRNADIDALNARIREILGIA